MTMEEAKIAFYHQVPVIFEGLQYPYIHALRYQWHSPLPIVQLELLDRNRNSVVLASPKRVSPVDKLPIPEEHEREGDTLYQWQGVRMIKTAEGYVVSGPDGAAKASKNKLSAWTGFVDLLDGLVRRQIGEELTAQGKNRYTGEEDRK